MNEERIRKGDAIEIAGNYQYDALHSGFVVQRFWHQTKLDIVACMGLPDGSMSALDLGSGSGVLADFLAGSAREVLGIDGNLPAVEFAQSHFRRPNLKFRHGLLHELKLPGESFDIIYMFEVIEHLYAQQACDLLTALRPLLKNGGRVVLTTPDYSSLWPLVEFLMDKFGLAPKMDGEQHVFRLTRPKLFALADKAGFRVSRFQRECGLAPFTSVLGWKLAEKVRVLERRTGGLFGMILCAELRPL